VGFPLGDLLEHHRIDTLIFPTTPKVALPRAEDNSVYRDGKPAFSWFYFSHTVYNGTYFDAATHS
jgi:hypothetical protein